MADKPTLVLAGQGKHLDIDELIRLFKAMAGREPTAAEIEEAEAELSK
jgi:hypothetical protein